MSPSNPFESQLHGRALDLAQRIHDHLTPQTSAYAEIWLDEKKISVGEQVEEPIYGKTYLPESLRLQWPFLRETTLTCFQTAWGL